MASWGETRIFQGNNFSGHNPHTDRPHNLHQFGLLPNTNHDANDEDEDAAEAAEVSPTKKSPKKVEPAPKDPTVLEYRGTKKHKPRKYGAVTIYTDVGNSLWRVKPASGSKNLSHHSWKKADPKQTWNKLVKEVRRLTR